MTRAGKEQQKTFGKSMEAAMPLGIFFGLMT